MGYRIVENKVKTIDIYSDGGCRSTAKQGEKIKEYDKSACAYFLKQGGLEKIGGKASYGNTNNAMEITGLILALRALKIKTFPVVAHLDSAYVVNCLQKGWWKKWERDGWTKKDGLKNAKLWEELIFEIRKIPFFSIEKVKGHSGNNDYNDLVDKYLNKLMDELPDIRTNNFEEVKK